MANNYFVTKLPGEILLGKSPSHLLVGRIGDGEKEKEPRL